MNCTGRTSATRKDDGWGARPESKDVREMNGAKHKTANSSQTGWGGTSERKMVHREILCSFVLLRTEVAF